MSRTLERAFVALVRSDVRRCADATAIRALFELNGVSAEDTTAVLSSGAERLFSYRARVRGTLRELLCTALPRTVSRLGERFEASFDAFVAERGSRSEYLRDGVREFIDHAAPGWQADFRVPSYLPDLANHEALDIELGAAPSSHRGETRAELRLDRPVRFVDACRVVRYGHAVHELPANSGDRAVPVRRDVALFVYRDAAHALHYLELTAFAADLLAALRDGVTLECALVDACRAHSVDLEPVIPGVSTLLADLAARGALLGTARDEEPTP